MADNIAVTPGTGATIGADEISSVKYQRVKVILGADGVNDGDVASGNPLPVTGTVTVTGVATAANQSTGNSSLATIAGAVSGTEMQVDVLSMPTTTVQATNLDIRDLSSATDSVAVTDGGGSLTVDGTVAVTNAGITSIDGKITACNTGAVVLAAGSAAIGKLAANSGVDIGDVDVTSLPALAAGNNNIGDVDVASIAAGDNNIGNVDIVTMPNSKDQIDEATFVVKTVDFTASQTAQSIWTPGSGKKFVICDIVLSASAAGAITLFDNTDNTTLRVAKFNLAANGGAVVAYKKPYKSATADNVLKYTTGSGIAGSLTVSGFEV